MRTRYDEETGDKAYCAWKECGRNVSKAVRRLSEEGLAIHRNTLSEWRDKWGWKMRALREQKEDRTVKDAGKDGTVLIAGLEAQRERYEGFFETLGSGVIDVQATYAYTAVVRAIADVRRKVDPELDLYAATPDVMGKFVDFIRAGGHDKDFARQVFDLIDRLFDVVKPQ